MANDTKKYGKRYKIKGANAMRFTAHSPNQTLFMEPDWLFTSKPPITLKYIVP